MEPILKAYFNKFKESFALDQVLVDLSESLKESTAFEIFVNYVMFSTDYPDIFIGNFDLLESVCVGGGNDTGIDGLGIKLNGRLVGSKDDIDTIISNSNKISIEFIFIQSKMQESIDSSELNNFGMGITNFLNDIARVPENEKIKYWRDLKDYLYNDDFVLKWEDNPRVKIYYVTASNNSASEHFNSILNIYKDEINKKCVTVSDFRLVTGRDITNYYKETLNSLSVSLIVNDIIPLSTAKQEKVKKAYIFTCDAKEFIKILSNNQDGSLRRSLFNANVRDYLGNKGSVNSEMEKTISDEPEMFLLCNNGITIVCSDFEQIKDKLVKVSNPQIVNGCQTSNSLFNFKDTECIDKVQVTVRVISTDDINISNKIVRGTNKQNQVLDEAFEATKPFHQYLEEYFEAQSNNPKLYYERRSKQYSNDILIPKTNIVNLRVITQTYVAMFLNAPHDGHRHEAKLLEKYYTDKHQIYNTEHTAEPYYMCALVWYMFEKCFREKIIPSKYKSFKSHLYFLFRQSINGYPTTSKCGKKSKYWVEMECALKEQNFTQSLPKILSTFDTAVSKWISLGNSRNGIKDREDFTHILKDCANNKIRTSKDEISKLSNLDQHLYKGEVIYVGNSKNGIRLLNLMIINIKAIYI